MEKVNNPDLSIIVLAYKSKPDLERLLPSVFLSNGVSFDADKSARYSAEAIVVDNGSDDETPDYLKTYFNGRPNLFFIQNQNTGFAAGNNLGITKSNGRYILLLNPDTKLEPDTLQTMLEFMEQHQEVGISGCKCVKENGKLDLACRRRFPHPWYSFKRLFLLDTKDYNYSNLDENLSMEVDSVVGAFLLIRRSVIDKIGLLDERFFMYAEDLDWCWRCKEAGFKVWYYPKTSITHYKGSSSAKIPFQALRWFHDSMWIFYKKHYAKQYPFIFNWLVFGLIYFRFSILALTNLFKSKPVVSQ